MTSTAATTATNPPAPGTTTGTPPALPAGFNQTTTPPATAGTSTSFVANTTAGGASYPTIPAPGSCTSPPPVKDPAQGSPGQAAGGGAVAGVNGAALAPVLQQLTGIIGQLSSLVGGTSGGGAPGKTPEQSTTQGGGAAATPPASTVAGANGSPAANAAQGAEQVQGGGATGNMDAVVKALQGVIEALNALIKALGSSVAGAEGGGRAEDPAQKDPKQKGEPPAAPKAGDVAGDNGPGQSPVQKTPEPPTVGGDNGPGQSPVQKTPEPAEVAGSNGGPSQAPTQKTPEPPTVGGDNGPGQSPAQKTPEPPKVGGDNGPGQHPGQKAPAVDGSRGGPPATPPAPAKPVVAQGNVILDNDDDRWSAKLTAKGGKHEHSVELWGDPHVVINVDGEQELFDVGYGAGKVTLFDGTVVSWDTYDKGDKHQYILRDFKVDSAGDAFDRKVTTSDRDGDKGDQMNVSTALTDAHLTELAIALRTMKGPMSEPLKNGTWTSPAYRNPSQGNPGQAA